jgi:hypothetical protein
MRQKKKAAGWATFLNFLYLGKTGGKNRQFLQLTANYYFPDEK